MKRLLVLAFLLPSMTTPLACRANDQPSATQAKIEQYMNAVVKQDHFMGSILVAQGDHVILAKGYGMADVKRYIPNTPDTMFRIGSNTKQFTAMVTLMMQEEGKLSVRDPICKYVPKCPKDWQPIAIYELLTHTSGIPNYTDFPSFRKVMSESVTPTQLIALFKEKPLDFKPGTKFSYSNSGYVVLGYIVERASGETYKKLLQQHIFGPLGMKDSGYDTNRPTEPNHAKGYRYTGNYEPAPFTDMSTPFSAGALYSTVRDLYTWDRALAAGKLIPAPLQKQMFTPQVQVPEPGVKEGVHYGFGWFISKQFGRTEYSHEGGIPGFTSVNSWFPKQHVYVIVLDNMLSPNVSQVARNLAAIVFGENYQIPRDFVAVTLPAKDLGKFVGTYQMAASKVFLTVTQTDDGLKAQLTGQPFFQIYPESKTHFFYKVLRAQLFFQTDAKDEVTGVVLHQNGRNIAGKRVAPDNAGQTAKVPKVISLSPEVLQKFVGTYQFSPGFSIAITRNADQLTAQATGQAAAPIYPESPSKFFLKIVDAQITFVSNGGGEVTGLSLHQGGHDMPAKKIK